MSLYRLRTAYGFDIATTSPLAGPITRATGESLELKVLETGGGKLFLRSTAGFEALVDGYWQNVTIAGVADDVVKLSNVPDNAKKLRYNWYSNPCGLYCFQCAVYVTVEKLFDLSGAEEFLPLPPFMADIPA